RAHPVQHVTIAGGFAKMTKLAQGATDLHSSRSSVDVAALAELLNELKAAPEQVARAHDAISAAQVLEIAGPLAPTLAATIARRAREVALATLAGGTEIEVRIYNREAKLLASSVDKAEGGS
ncbi:MAG: cobalt-precorrin-5B (C(1))-methyltransferase, partial [Rhodospirillaceae bacterium]|nr:cobalt-precorrin-5B (C(1))-methyltransferase [Rhodospirillaceae bacterium]